MQTFIIGRDASNHIVLNDKLVSRQHAKLTVSETGQIIIKDLGSSNGTFVNGNRITESVIKSGDIVKCGSVFLEWGKYVNGTAQTVQQMNSQQYSYDQSVPQGSTAVFSISQFNLKEVFKYLATRIFDIGDLFKTNWDRTASIIFFITVPVIITFIVSIITYSKFQIAGFYFSPTVLTLFLFTVCPFITFYLLSINMKVSFDKVALASVIIGFIQFCSLLCFAVYFWITFQHNSSNSYGNYLNNRFQSNNKFDLFNVATIVLLIILLVNLSIAFYVSIYKYFISIGVSKSKTIYLISIVIGLNSFLQALSAYIIYLVVKDSIGNLNF